MRQECGTPLGVERLGSFLACSGGLRDGTDVSMESLKDAHDDTEHTMTRFRYERAGRTRAKKGATLR